MGEEEEDYDSQESFRDTASYHKSSARSWPATRAHNGARTEHRDLPSLVRRMRTGKRSAWDELNFQSDVAELNPDARRLVDEPEKKCDFSYWGELLEFRQRIYGAQGVREVWRGIQAREIDLPTSGRNADALWGTFLRHKDMFEDILVYATSLRRRTGRTYEHLYENIVGHYLSTNNPRSAHIWHRRLKDDFIAPDGALSRLAPKAARSMSSLDVFRRIYLDSKDRHVYDSLVSALCEQGQYDAAMQWHSFLIKNRDYPSKASASKPMMRHFVAYGNRLSLGHVADITKGIATDEAVTSKTPIFQGGKMVGDDRFSREMMNRLLGRTHAVEPKVLDDKFCARLFATRAFTIDIVISGLGMLGVEEIGPLALRELAVRAETPEGTLQKLEQLKASGISIRQSVFSSAVVKFAAEDRTQLLDSVLSTDQHPDVFEDQELQKTLLSSYIKAQDWPNVHLTLGILTVLHSEPFKESWNLLLRNHSQHSDHATLIQVLEDMRMSRIRITSQSFTSLYQHRLRPRRPGQRPATQGRAGDDLLLITNVWRSALESGRSLHPLRWREILKRFGMTGRFEELSRLTHWMITWYSTRGSGTTKALPVPEIEYGAPSLRSNLATYNPLSRRTQALDKIFTIGLLNAMVAWGFNAGFMSVQRQYERRLGWAEQQQRQRQRQHQYSTLSRSSRSTSDQASQLGVTHDDFSISPPHDNISPTTSLVTPTTSASPLVSTHSLSKPTTIIPLRRVSPTSLPHLSGLRLLQSLRARGVYVQTSTVRYALRQRLWILFGPGRSAVRFNRRARLLNPYSIEHFVVGAEKLWGGSLFGLPEELLQRLQEHESERKRGVADAKVRLALRAELLFRLFGARPVIKKRRNARVDERIWTKVLERRIFRFKEDERRKGILPRKRVREPTRLGERQGSRAQGA